MESPPEFIGFSRAKKDVRVHQLNITVSWDRLLEEEYTVRFIRVLTAFYRIFAGDR